MNDGLISPGDAFYWPQDRRSGLSFEKHAAILFIISVVRYVDRYHPHLSRINFVRIDDKGMYFSYTDTVMKYGNIFPGWTQILP